MARFRGALSQRSSVGRVDPLHNSVLKRNPPAKQNTQANVFTSGRARGGFSRSSGRVHPLNNSLPTNGTRQIRSQGEPAENVQSPVPRTQANGTPTRCSQRTHGVSASSLSLPSNRRARPNTPQGDNRVRRSLIQSDQFNVSSAMRNNESQHDRTQQSPDVNGDVQSTPSVSNPRRSLCNSPQSRSRQHSERNPLIGGSNSHNISNQEDEATTVQPRTTRGKTSLAEMSKRRKYGDSKPVLAVTPNKNVVGLKSTEFSLAIGMWVSQRENIPLNIKLFKEAPTEYVDRVVQLARDNYTFKDDNDFTTEVLRHRIRLRYNGFRSTLSKHFRFNCGNDYDRALLNPPEEITNQEDWEFLCKHFSSDEFQKRSAQARKARSAQVLPHSNGPKSFSQTLHDRVLNGEPIDPVTMFEVTHEFKKCKDTTKCDEIKEKMKAMKDQVDSGELEMSLEEIYQMSISSTTTSSRKRRRGSDSTDYFSKTEEQMAAIQTKLDEANSARENQAKEIRRLKNKWENRENNMKLFLNQFLESVGRDPLPPNVFDCEEEESETEKEDEFEREGSHHSAGEDVDREYNDEVRGHVAGGIYSDDEYTD